MREYPALDQAHRDALQAFADAHKSKAARTRGCESWKDELSMIYWYNARIWRGPEESMGTRLHNIRNNFGPTWLYDVCDVKPAPKAK
jgi:hypothetical protein